jgi:hypothetical protein
MDIVEKRAFYLELVKTNKFAFEWNDKSHHFIQLFKKEPIYLTYKDGNMIINFSNEIIDIKDIFEPKLINVELGVSEEHRIRATTFIKIRSFKLHVYYIPKEKQVLYDLYIALGSTGYKRLFQ